MSAPDAYFYCDDTTRAALAESREKVLLLGSYGGFSNFGDVLQLKGAIAWHRAATKLEPVLICHTTAIPDSGFCERQRSWFGVRAILYWSADRLDMAAAGLTELSESIQIGRLHVYGGGFLNRYWGAGTVTSIEGVMQRFGVGQYALSGQQIDEQFVPELREHFRRFKPALAGGRDPLSARLLEACGVEADDSFDDAAEALRELAAQCRAAERGEADLLLHLNFSYYTGAERLEQTARVLSRIAERARERRGGGEPRVVLLHAYADQRTDEIVDALGAVSLLEDRFPFLQFETIELGRHALLAGQAGVPRLAIPSAPLAVSSSYHVSILLSLIGVPCHVLASNAYYEQKRNGLGSGTSVDEFLATLAVTDLTARFALREPWLRRLGDVFSLPPETRQPQTAPPTESPPRAWRPKTRMVRSELESARDQAQSELAQAADRLRGSEAYAASLKSEVDKLWSECQSLAAGFEERGQIARDLQRQIVELRQETDKLCAAFDERGEQVAAAQAEAQKVWAELQAMAKGFEERGQVVRQTEETCRRLWDDNQRIERLLAEQTAEAARLREELERRWWRRLARGARKLTTRS